MSFESPQKLAKTNIHNQKVTYNCAVRNAIYKAMADYTGGTVVVVLPETKFFDILRQIIEELEAANWFVRYIVSKEVLIIGDSKESVDKLYHKQLDIKEL